MASPLPTASSRASSKLRKSCDLCAATKVGCTKEKPSCARCAKRDHPCVYSTAKRAGRTSGKTHTRARRDSALTMTATMTATASPSPTFTSAQASDTTSPSTPDGGGLSPSLGLQRQCSPYPDIFGALRSLDENCLSSLPASSFPDLDELFASAVGLPLEQQDDAATFFDFTLDDTRTCPFPAPELITHPTSPTSAVRPHIDAAPTISRPTSAACQCLARALALLADLSPGNPGCGNDPGATATPTLPDFERVLAQNEQTSETVRRILQCNCTNDSYLLITLSLVVFRVIAWYTAATGAASGEDPLEPVLQGPPSSPDCACEDEQRIAVQRILSKLAGVQASVDLLAQRLRRISETAGEEPPDTCDPSLHMTGPLAGGIHAFLKPFSPGLVNTLEADLRKRLCDLSRAIVDRLRR
ncbi:uncharacterized protein BO95DRAFT_507094 [Aspergillus brunneoviolaceus CBS 621.78]|uniref:Uncharacterized protein n=1 Tax=Aspergillus brunneoviolaceus CBS 621.78 TaxID=1450534 RepID=A0ACD1FW96_9EURO|nr:hypothetical protein BO95DRAFT_507094 [Aspergillus brunneoviolaceus CBS 621.78]RAH41243.1 hypothetical protein BO95DRAFT_507094 [Aspergillus brunneoviolaceus CBS 621.78]